MLGAWRSLRTVGADLGALRSDGPRIDSRAGGWDEVEASGLAAADELPPLLPDMVALASIPAHPDLLPSLPEDALATEPHTAGGPRRRGTLQPAAAGPVETAGEPSPASPPLSARATELLVEVLGIYDQVRLARLLRQTATLEEYEALLRLHARSRQSGCR